MWRLGLDAALTPEFAASDSSATGGEEKDASPSCLDARACETWGMCLNDRLISIRGNNALLTMLERKTGQVILDCRANRTFTHRRLLPPDGSIWSIARGQRSCSSNGTIWKFWRQIQLDNQTDGSPTLAGR